MLLPRRPILEEREESNGGSDKGKGGPNSGTRSTGHSTATIVVVSIAISTIAAISIFFLLKRIRLRHPSSRYVPTKYLKQKWERWDGTGLGGKVGYSSRLDGNRSTATLNSRHTRPGTAETTNTQHGAASDETANGEVVNRHTSVRSIMTLPAYSRSVRESERVLGREGERDGIDIVLEQPETEEAEEERREEEMESLYQIRVQRRREVAEREARRAERREARMRGDTVTLERLRREAAARAQEQDLTDAATMVAEHRSRQRERAVSSVSYASLGVARHDGSRIRANSDESDRHPLLDSAASIDGGSIRPSRTQDSTSLYAHGRERSTSSVLSASDTVTDLEIPFGRAGSDFEVVNLNQAHSRHASGTHSPYSSRSRASSSANAEIQRPAVETTEDVADGRIPSTEPPAYDREGFEEAPPYTSPVLERRSEALSLAHAQDESQLEAESQRLPGFSGLPMLPELDRLPSIRIASATPIEAQRGFDWVAPVQSSVAGQR